MRYAITIAVLFFAATLRADYREFTYFPKDPSIETKLRFAIEATLKAYPKMKAEDLAISVVDVTNPSTISRGDVNGDAPFYPASVIKLFFMADVYATRKEKVPDVDRALKNMIVESDNDATAYIVDVLAETTSSVSLEGRALRRYIDKRREINRRFQKLGYADYVSAMMKTWSFAPYGADLQVLGENRVNRNKLTANATASMMLWIVRRRAPASEAQMTLLHRPLAPVRAGENQVKEFIGEALPSDAKLWSKAGWTSEVRHDAAYFELPGGKKLILVIFTRGSEGFEGDKTLIPVIARNVLSELQ
jgi:beta-lactamase class A